MPGNITVSGGSLVTAAPKSDIGNYGDATVYNWLVSDVSSYNSLTSSTLPAPTANANNSPFVKVDSGFSGGTVNIPLNSTYDYIFLHWGGQGGGSEQAYYIGGLSGSYDFNPPPGGHPQVGGLSFYSLYGPGTSGGSVPDNCSTLVLFGLAMTGLAVVARRKKCRVA